tara:strand:+ start:3240 stop:3632 length:393 start_codon:yes stop_codon:yes gene_type:complete
LIKTIKGFALVEVVIVIVLISGSMLVFLEALGQAKSYQLKSEITTIQSTILNSKVNEIRARGYNLVPLTHGFINVPDYSNYLFSINTSFVDENLNSISNDLGLKLIKITVKHSSNNYNEINETLLISNEL